jgi:DNA-binding GntR family transcriptional regulator
VKTPIPRSEEGEPGIVTDGPFHRRNLPTLTTAVQGEIERRILTGDMPAGSRINEVELARSMGVSRGPVREALRALQQGGLVDIVANRGVIVRQIGAEEALGLYDLRAVVLGLACERLALMRDEARLEALEKSLAQSAEAIRDGDRERYYRLNLEFHAMIVGGCGHERLRATYESIVKEMHLFRRRGLSAVPNLEASLAEHRAIVDAVRKGDAKTAFEAGRHHVLSGRERFRRSLES